MKYTAALAALVGVVACAPNGVIDIGDGVKLVPREPRAAMRAERLREHRRSLMQVDDSADFAVGSKNNSDVSYSTNWSGAVKIGTGLADVYGTIVRQLSFSLVCVQGLTTSLLGCAHSLRP